ncbi:zinc finger protein VAR3, chloroplastic isoform X2 [Solanum lycopersicum]|uniref:RanBP2-type domain-containing protein n=1 Tax=Solanum lycopersicum TaxID=4081 RepID=A0A3Q7HLU3_SOLLC|nr:zinc finger protein VAR3, chloroplastic isoform X2 [Solanum lycopersicum]
MLKMIFASSNKIIQNSSISISISISNFHTKNSAIQFVLEEGKTLQSQQTTKQNEEVEFSRKPNSGIQTPQLWPEWVNLMDKLLKMGCFDGFGNPFGNAQWDANLIRTACLNFARHRFDLIRYLSPQDIEVLASCGCPSMDRKVVNSGKRLRLLFGIEEGNVCSFCILRGSCERAYAVPHKDQGGRTVDVMRLLLTYGLNPITGAVENKPSLNKRVEESARKLLKEIVNFSSEELFCETKKSTNPWNPSVQRDHEEGQINALRKHGDWVCPECNFLNFSRNAKCLRCNGLNHERLNKLRQEQDHLPLKKGDWICSKCHFMNFAKNTRCLQCTEKPPKRHLNPGEWECESCNYINFKRNTVCLKCDHRRPKASSCAGSSCGSANQSRTISRTRPYFGELNEETDEEWQLIESEREDRLSSMPENEVVDFPVLGGNSELSRDAKKQERWKTGNKRENGDELNKKYFQNSGNEEMDEWFGHKNV